MEMLEQVLNHIHNYFYHGKPISGTFTISDGALTLNELQDDQYYHITGSVFNDGIHQYPNDRLKDETFTGKIYPMAVPDAVIGIVYDIEAWMDKYGEAVSGPYQSESVIGVYSYQLKAGASGGADGSAGASWQSVFAPRLDMYRKVSGR